MGPRSKIIFGIALCTFASLLVALPVSPVQAQGLGGVNYSWFKSDITINPDASFDVVETIEGEFEEQRHGIFRFIPFRYERPGELPLVIRLRVLSVLLDERPVQFQQSRSGDFEVLKIGDPDRTFDGPFRYEITYRVENAILYHEGGDELYWNVTGNEWDAPIDLVTTTVRVPGATAEQIQGDCYRGPFGSTRRCTQTIEDELYSASAPEPITISVRFPKGVVEKPGAFTQAMWWLQENWDLFSLLIPLAAIVFLFWHWWHHGRDRKGRGTIIAEYEPPDDLHPAELGTLVDAKFQPREFSATLVDLAVRGYLRIVEKKKEGLFGGTEYQFERAKPADHHLHPYEKTLYDALFGSEDSVTLDDRRTELTKARKDVEAAVYDDVAHHGYYVKNPNTARGTYVGIAIAIGFVAFMIGGSLTGATGRPVMLVALIATALVFLAFAPFMPKKTHKGALAAEHGLGFKEYLSKAEKYRLQWQEKEGIFEAFLPYAMVFGVADKWSQALADTQTSSPIWYVGSFGHWDTNAFNDRMNSFTSSLATASAPQSSGGAGGGGFSGGGFGGGGGGSW